jgi:hypothetical protein
MISFRSPPWKTRELPLRESVVFCRSLLEFHLSRTSLRAEKTECDG